MTAYSPTLLAQAGYSDIKQNGLAGGINTIGIIGTIISAQIIDRLGRRVCLMGGAAILSAVNLIVIISSAARSAFSWQFYRLELFMKVPCIILKKHLNLRLVLWPCSFCSIWGKSEMRHFLSYVLKCNQLCCYLGYGRFLGSHWDIPQWSTRPRQWLWYYRVGNWGWYDHFSQPDHV